MENSHPSYQLSQSYSFVQNHPNLMFPVYPMVQIPQKPYQSNSPLKMMDFCSMDQIFQNKEYCPQEDIQVSEFNFDSEISTPNDVYPKIVSVRKGMGLMEIEEESMTPLNNIQSSAEKTPPKSSKFTPSLQVTVGNKFCKPSNFGKIDEKSNFNKSSNTNIINMWRNNQEQVFKGKFSSGATPKPCRDLNHHIRKSEYPDSNNTNSILSQFRNKKLKKQSKFKLSFENQKENIDSQNNVNQIQNITPRNDRTPSPKNKSHKDMFYNTMSIKKERKIFNRNEDLAMADEERFEEDGQNMDIRYMSSTKNNQSLGFYSRFMNDYEVREVIGTGCFGTVYQCVNKFDNMMYAIKCTKNRLKGSKSRDLSLHEAQALAAFSACDENSFIVRYYNAWIEDERLYLVMEHCKHSLKFLKQIQQYFPESQIRYILRDISLGLKSLHKRNVVHLDIKPENILLSNTGKYKISDLGLSRIAKRSKDEEINEGDSRYLAPELLHDFTVGELPDLTKADIFSLGVTIYELITGENIPSNGEEWHRIRNLQLPRLFCLSNYSETLKMLVKNMMNPNPDLRPSAEELLVSDFLRSEIEMELKWEKTQNNLLKKQIEEYEKILKLKRKNSF